MDINEIMKLLPHRYPFLMVDKILEIDPGKSLKALKNVTINEPYFQGHFPHRPVMPAVLMMEALAQATGLLAYKTGELKPNDQSVFYFAGIDKARFKRPVGPGDQLILQVELIKRKRNIWVFKGIAMVNDEVAASAELMCAEQEA
ncbi:MAG TPA: 3-hydroxyacyl-ACP dehydratase FabZ [Gammaproteobacteria bacterium]|nr:3-hydroxyacyl-ACP dehydratase FabZ [Gammaproteobacteria bacterium]